MEHLSSLQQTKTAKTKESYAVPTSSLQSSETPEELWPLSSLEIISLYLHSLISTQCQEQPYIFYYTHSQCKPSANLFMWQGKKSIAITLIHK